MAKKMNNVHSKESADKSNADLKKIFRKSLKLLDKSEHDLREIRKTLKKTVVRLTVAAKGDNEELNELLERIKTSVNDGIKIKELEAGLDEIFVTLNHVKPVKSQPKISNNENNAERFLPEIFTSLIERLDLNSITVEQKSELINKVLAENSDIETWLKIANKLSAYINDDINIVQNDKKDLSEFIVKIRAQLDSIENYVKNNHTDLKTQENQASCLQNAIDTSVDEIKKKVEYANDIPQLKKDIEEHLNNIHDTMEENRIEREKQAALAHENNKKMMLQMLASRQETEKLQVELKQSREKLLIDTLTSLPNRLAYNDRLEVEIQRMKRSKEPLCIALWDIDNFKSVNDEYGHDVGDRVLKLFSKIIATQTRELDMFARVGGEEFVLLMPNTALEDALELNEKLRERLAEHTFRYEEKICPVTASVGLAEFDNDLPDAETAFKQADKALYKSKHSGKNQCTIYQPGM